MVGYHVTCHMSTHSRILQLGDSDVTHWMALVLLQILPASCRLSSRITPILFPPVWTTPKTNCHHASIHPRCSSPALAYPRRQSCTHWHPIHLMACPNWRRHRRIRSPHPRHHCMGYVSSIFCMLRCIPRILLTCLHISWDPQVQSSADE
jgi:hypothetical protein